MAVWAPPDVQEDGFVAAARICLHVLESEEPNLDLVGEAEYANMRRARRGERRQGMDRAAREGARGGRALA